MEKLIERLARLETSVVSDVLDEAGFPDQTLTSAFRQLDPGVKLAGEALCARGRSVVRGPGGGEGLSPYTIERQVKRGNVVVLDVGSEHVGAAVGGFVSATLKAKGCNGVVVNGAIRDSLEIKALGLPAFFRSTSPMNASRRWELVQTGNPVMLPGATGAAVTIHPGDLLLGDADGVVVIPSRWAAEIIAAAEQLMEIEDRIRREVAGGATREEAFARNPRFKHIKRLAA